MSLSATLSSFSILSLLLHLDVASAHPTSISKRSTGLTRGATAGLAIGIAVGGILLTVVVVFLFIHLRSRARTTTTNRTRGIPSHEKHHSTATTIANDNVTSQSHEVWVTADGKQASQPTTSLPRRKKSLKDHLMGPLYQDSQTNLPDIPLPTHIRRSRMMKGANTSAGQVDKSDEQLEEEFIGAGGSGQRNTVQSFSSRRATRLMMLM